MRIRFFHPPLEANRQQAAFIEVLQKAWEANQTTLADDQKYDLLHILGRPSLEVVEKIRCAKKKRIPVLYSPLSEITPWSEKHINHPLAKQLFIHTTGEAEYNYIKKRYSDANVILMKNPAVTVDTTQTLFNSELQQLYQQILKQHDEQVKADIDTSITKLKTPIDDEIMHAVLKGFLYLHYKYGRRQILQQDIDAQSQLMLTADYDEDKLGIILKELKIYRFVSGLETVMEKKSQLTEGFMPIPATNGHLTKHINSATL